MDKKLLDILVCPICKGTLVYRKDVPELICKFDRLAFPIRDGIQSVVYLCRTNAGGP